MRIALAFLLLLAAPAAVVSPAAPAGAQEPPRLAPPIACALGQDCWLMNYADTDPGPAAQDFQCRPRSYQGHDGTDFAIRDAAVMAAGVPVLASAPGEVVGMRDGEPDGALLGGGKVDGKECGNGIMLRHEGGWTTQYCHMRQGSVTVRPGQKVERGAVLGMVGLSGKTEFPHVHLTVRQDNRPIDPFTGAAVAAGCGQPAKPLWPVPYQAAALYAAGFAAGVPQGPAIKADARSPDTLPRDVPLVLWGAAFGVAPGDTVRMVVTGPDGAEIVNRAVVLDRHQAWRMEATGRKPPAGGWAAGAYRGEVRLERAGLPPATRSATVTLR
jgi:hypothetical protein